MVKHAPLNRCLSLDASLYEELHKGTPFYWTGTAAFMLHDYRTAAFFHDAAISEDLRAGADPVGTAPGRAGGPACDAGKRRQAEAGSFA